MPDAKRASRDKGGKVSGGGFTLARRRWQSEEVLGDLSSVHLNVDGCKVANIREEMWRNLIAEFDAVHLSARLRMKAHVLSREFLQFEETWLSDEINHYNGLKCIFSAVFGESESDLDTAVKAREPDFANVARFIEDEFVACACFAYDELASVRGYVAAFPLYDSFGPPSIKRWIRLTARDEMLHSVNAQNLIRNVHGARLGEVPEVLRTIVDHESSDPDDYKGTFLFDHGEAPGDNPFSRSFLKQCANDVCRYLGVPPAYLEETA
jgi:hypothetical protein